MTEHSWANHSRDPIGDLVDQLLDCGAVLSQMVAHTVAWEAAAPTSQVSDPGIIRSMVRSVLDGVGKAHSKRDIRVAAQIVDQVTQTICAEIFLVNPEMIARLDDGELDP